MNMGCNSPYVTNLEQQPCFSLSSDNMQCSVNVGFSDPSARGERWNGRYSVNADDSEACSDIGEIGDIAFSPFCYEIVSN